MSCHGWLAKLILIQLCLLAHLHMNVLSHTVLEPEDELKEILRSYKQYRRPTIEINSTSSFHAAVQVEVSLEITGIGSISILNMDMSMDFMLLLRWTDPRLKLNSTGYNETVSVSYFRDKIWIPDLYIRNAKTITSHGKTNQLLWLRGRDGRIIYSQKLGSILNCPMSLLKFPFDSQTCKIELSSYGYPIDQLNFTWWQDGNRPRSRAAHVGKYIELNEFRTPKVTLGTCRSYYSTTGAFTCIHAELKFERIYGFYLFFAYFPSFLVVNVSWIQFMIDPNAVPARISLGLLSVLALITQNSAIVAQMPRVSYVKALDVWFLTCMIFVVFSLMEFAVVNRRARIKKKLAEKKEKKKSTSSEVDRPIQPCDESSAPLYRIRRLYRRPNDLDKICFYLYPICFVIFIFIYCIIYLS